jgi:hypothetical protein
MSVGKINQWSSPCEKAFAQERSFFQSSFAFK